jgi:polyferredoxin
MDKMGYPGGLIRYTTENAMEGKPAHILRPRVIVYATLLLLITGSVVYGIATRIPLQLDVIRDRNALYRQTNEGLVENIYTLKVANMDKGPHVYHLSLEGIEGMSLVNHMGDFKVASGEVLSVPIQVQVDPVRLKRPSSEIRFEIVALDDPGLSREEAARFLGPVLP